MPYVPNPADWVAALLQSPGAPEPWREITIRQLYQLLEAEYVTQSGAHPSGGDHSQRIFRVHSSILNAADTDLMVFTGLTADVLDRANRFLRLWTATGLQMWELDWAIRGYVKLRILTVRVSAFPLGGY